MSFFGKNNQTADWGGIFKTALSKVETQLSSDNPTIKSTNIKKVNSTQSLSAVSNVSDNRSDTKNTAINDLFAAFGIEKTQQVSLNKNLTSNKKSPATTSKTSEIGLDSNTDFNNDESSEKQDVFPPSEFVSSQASYQELAEKLNKTLKIYKELKKNYDQLSNHINNNKNQPKNANLDQISNKCKILEKEIQSSKETIKSTKALRQQMRQVESEKNKISNIVMQNTAPLLKKIEHLQLLINTKDMEINEKNRWSKSREEENSNEIKKLSTKLQETLHQLEQSNLETEKIKKMLLESAKELKTSSKTKSEDFETLEMQCRALKKENSTLIAENLNLKKSLENDFSYVEALKENTTEPIKPKNNVNPRNTKEFAKGILKSHPEEHRRLSISRNQVNFNDPGELSPKNTHKKNNSDIPNQDQFQTSFPEAPQLHLGTVQDNKQLNNQISTLKSQLQLLLEQKTRIDSELTTKNLKISLLESVQKEKQDIELKYRQLEKRYSTSLELLGERTEMVNEMKNQIKEAREIYTKQIEELLSK
ncbi:hypothetical protein BB558_003998 [Smittium angustum]|uniref:TATA element modulatory factor 1 TATA binding domain-containing protein n=1 Tax=Smittium angustum TaxID=133377 RepID=A0A2U1J4K8_SMIAN|nr:hypothetical protein BB558_003998 [Smittium angustum]